MAEVNNERARYIALLESRLPGKKVKHCISAADLMASFAEGLGLDADEVLAAGLLHDIGRKLSKGELLDRAADWHIEITEAQRLQPKLLHGPVAAEECCRGLNIASPRVYEAVYWHTTGRPGLGLLGQALYFADFAEPLREYPEAKEARRRLVWEGFPAALRYVAERKLFFLQQKDVIDPHTTAFYQWLCAETGP